MVSIDVDMASFNEAAEASDGLVDGKELPVKGTAIGLCLVKLEKECDGLPVSGNMLL